MKRSYSCAAAVNNDDVLNQCLLASPDMSLVDQFKAYRQFPSASAAYNVALAECASDVIILAHQDVYLPRDFIQQLDAQIDAIEQSGASWGVIGLIGISPDGIVGGQVWSSGISGVVGREIQRPMAVDSLDEMVLILRCDAGLRFDEGLPGFHLYGLDIVQIARQQGYSSWAVQCPAVHHSKPLLTLDHTFRKAWLYMRSKWQAVLPVRSLVCTIESLSMRLWIKVLRMRWKSRRLTTRINPPGAPGDIAQRLGWE